jgi:hypothetical protein
MPFNPSTDLTSNGTGIQPLVFRLLSRLATKALFSLPGVISTYAVNHSVNRSLPLWDSVPSGLWAVIENNPLFRALLLRFPVHLFFLSLTLSLPLCLSLPLSPSLSLSPSLQRYSWPWPGLLCIEEEVLDILLCMSLTEWTTWEWAQLSTPGE